MDRVPGCAPHQARVSANRLFFVLLVLTTSVNVRWVNAQEDESDCVTPDGNRGICQSIMQCPDMMRKIPRPLTPAFADYLRTFHCDGFNGAFDGMFPNICCQLPEPAPDPTTIAPPTSETLTVVLEDREGDLEYVSAHEKLRLLPAADCGPILGDKISNGNRTDLFEFPWMVLLQYRTHTGLEFQCGGTLISDRYVLTAAHCVKNLPPKTLALVSVRVGEHDLAAERDCQDFQGEILCADPVQDVPVERTIAHDKFNKPFASNDIALIRLNRQVNITTDSVRAICLPVSDEVQNLLPQRVTITGWGTTENQTQSQLLLQAAVPVVTNRDCQAIFKRAIRLRDSQMCAGGELGVDSCAGDSGGPLVYPANIGGARMVQFGVISLGAKHCRSDNVNPGIYTRVSHYMKWILDNMED